MFWKKDFRLGFGAVSNAGFDGFEPIVRDAGRAHYAGGRPDFHGRLWRGEPGRRTGPGPGRANRLRGVGFRGRVHRHQCPRR